MVVFLSLDTLITPNDKNGIAGLFTVNMEFGSLLAASRPNEDGLS